MFIKVELVPPAIENGVVLTCGAGDTGQLGLGPDVEEKTRPCTVSDLSDAVQVVAGGLHSLCLTKDGKVSRYNISPYTECPYYVILFKTVFFFLINFSLLYSNIAKLCIQNII